MFGISVVLSFLVWGLIAAQYLWPALRNRSRADALRPLLYLHAFRFVGLAFLIPGVVSPDLPAAFALPAAVGDIVASILALASLALLRLKAGIALVWVFNIWGAADLLYAFYAGNHSNLAPGAMGAAYFIPVVLVPLLLVTHALVFRILLSKASS
jgi:hypothetical protein